MSVLKQLRLFDYIRPYHKFTPIAQGDNVTVLQSNERFAIKCGKVRRNITKNQAETLIENSKTNDEIDPHHLDIYTLEMGLLGKNFGLTC